MGVAIVTGGASGIGRALAAELVRRRDTVIVADIAAHAAEATAKELTDRGGGAAVAAALDVSDAEAVEHLVARAEYEHGPLDLMVNNAGIAVTGAAEELTLAHWNRSIDVNLRGVVHGVQAAYPRMVRRRAGQILNTASMAGLGPGPFTLPYSAAKHAVVGLSLGLRIEGRPHGVKVSVLCPGIIDTPIYESSNPGLPPTSGQAFARETFRRLAETLQGGKFYPAESLARDALRGLDRDTAVIVAPRQAKVLWFATRYLPLRWSECMLLSALKGTRLSEPQAPRSPLTDAGGVRR
jgi:NAD(P)-dependent dehydrogenase (short-subunit alcohol dehydrogenase family)